MYEWVDGGDLKAFLNDHNRRRMLSLSKRVKLLEDMARGLWVLHYGCRAPIRHKDFKPQNIMLDRNMSIAKLGDYGVAKEQATEVDSTPEAMAGTQAYLCPAAVAAGVRTIASDVYPFGLVVF